MQHTNLFSVQNNITLKTEPIHALPKHGVINLFFAGADDYGRDMPPANIRRAVMEYVDDRKIRNLDWHLIFAHERNPTPDDEERSTEKLARILGYNEQEREFSAGRPYFREHIEFVNELLLPKEHAAPLIMSDGTRVDSEAATREVHKAKMHLSRFNLMGFCYGTITIQQILLAMDRVLRDRGYNKDEIKDIKSSLCCMNYAPICQIPKANEDVPQLFFASGIDSVAKNRIDYTQEYGTTNEHYDMHQLGRSVLIVSHMVSPLPHALRIKRKEFRVGDSPLTINAQNDGYGATLRAIQQGKVSVQELQPPRDDAYEKAGHNMRVWFNLERLTGSQTRGGETFPFPSTLFARWAHDILLDNIKASDHSEKNHKPRDAAAIIDHAMKRLSPQEIGRRIKQFHDANQRYAAMIEAARENGAIVQR